MLTPINKVLINLNDKVQDQIIELHQIVQEFNEVNFESKPEDYFKAEENKNKTIGSKPEK